MSIIEYVLPLQVTASLLFACRMPLANPATIIALPIGDSKAYLTLRENPFLASITLAVYTRIELINDITKRLVIEVESVAKLIE